jgi:small subunit ribosomal protein S18
MNKECFFTANGIKNIDYKDVDILKRFVNPFGRITARKRTGVCANKQRELAEAIKRSRFMGLMPYVAR